ncbi:MAG: mismatch-specific DNA-glycosylase [SAR202 cluster bacterium]|nr:mismatch-specific DNA-glycosylase [SAR202 cluster bacterium]
MQTLPDYLHLGLDIVFVGINPGLFSAKVGHYFAMPRNRFWTALNRSGLVSIGRDLGPDDDALMPSLGIGFTDVVKRPSAMASNLAVADYRSWAPVCREKLLRYASRVICFNGLVGYNNFRLFTDGVREKAVLGVQPGRIGDSRVFVAPSPSPANAAYSLDDLAEWYRRLAEFRDAVKRGDA